MKPEYDCFELPIPSHMVLPAVFVVGLLIGIVLRGCVG